MVKYNNKREAMQISFMLDRRYGVRSLHNLCYIKPEELTR